MMKKLLKVLTVLAAAAMLLTGCTGGNKSNYDLAGKTFYNTTDRFGYEEHAKVWFGKDGTYVLTDNFDEGVYELTGKWSVKENVVTLEVNPGDLGDITKILFEIKDEKTLTLRTTLAGSESDNTFSTDKPTGGGSAAPTAAPGPITNNTGGDSGSSGSSGSSTTPTTAPTSAPAPTPTAAPEAEYVAYYNASQGKGKNGSFVEFHDDGSFTLVEIQGLGATEVQGLWGMEGNMILFSNLNEKLPTFYDMAGNPVYNFEMEVIDENTLIIQRGLQSTNQYDIFTTDGTIPPGLEATGWITDPGDGGEYFDGVFRHDPVEGVMEQHLPTVEFTSDGKFWFIENCYAGMGKYLGWYEVTEDGYLCHVTDASTMKGFAGQDVTLIEFKKYDAAMIWLKTDLCMSRNGDKFYVLLGKG